MEFGIVICLYVEEVLQAMILYFGSGYMYL